MKILRKKKKNKKTPDKDTGKFNIFFFFPKHKFPELLLLGQFISKWIEGTNNTNEIINSFL